MAKVKKEEPVLTVNGTKFLFADLTEEAKTQFFNVQAAEAEINRLQMQLAIAQTARNTYQQALIGALPAEV